MMICFSLSGFFKSEHNATSVNFWSNSSRMIPQGSSFTSYNMFSYFSSSATAILKKTCVSKAIVHCKSDAFPQIFDN